MTIREPARDVLTLCFRAGGYAPRPGLRSIEQDDEARQRFKDAASSGAFPGPMGHAAGCAAALAVRSKTSVRRLGVAHLQEVLGQQGACIHEGDVR